MRALLAAAVLTAAATVLPATAAAQGAPDGGGPAFRVEPYAGVFLDGAYGRDDSGPVAGLRASYPLSDRWRLSGHLGYADLRDPGRSGTAQAFFTFRYDYLLAAAGVEVEPLQGKTTASLGLQLGSVLRQTDVEESFGNPPEEFDPGDDFVPSAVVVPSVALHRDLSPRWRVGVTLQDYVFVDRFPLTQSFALTAGVSFGIR